MIAFVLDEGVYDRLRWLSETERASMGGLRGPGTYSASTTTQGMLPEAFLSRGKAMQGCLVARLTPLMSWLRACHQSLRPATPYADNLNLGWSPFPGASGTPTHLVSSTISASDPVRKSGQTESQGYSGTFTPKDVHYGEDARPRDSAGSEHLRPSSIPLAQLAQLMPPHGRDTAGSPFQPTKPGEQRMLPNHVDDGIAVPVDRVMGEGEGEDLYRPAVGGAPGDTQGLKPGQDQGAPEVTLAGHVGSTQQQPDTQRHPLLAAQSGRDDDVRHLERRVRWAGRRGRVMCQGWSLTARWKRERLGGVPKSPPTAPVRSRFKRARALRWTNW